MRVFIGGLATETNTFSPIPTAARAFAETMLLRGDATRHAPAVFSLPLHIWRRRSESLRYDVIEGLCAAAEAGGVTARVAYEQLRDELLDNILSAGPLDMVLLSMHGAMVAHGYLDCEGDMLQRIRSLVGNQTTIGVELDPHCNVTPAMTGAADILICYKENPHTDIDRAAEEVFSLCCRVAADEIRPVIEIFDCRMVAAWRTTDEPMASFVAGMRELEGRDGILSVSFIHNFAWNDTPHKTACVMVTADGDRAKARQLATELGGAIWSMRERTARKYMSIEETLRRVHGATRHPVVLADVCDNPGGGAPGDATYLLRAAMIWGIPSIAAGFYYDPSAVQFCIDAGRGATLDLRIGGKMCRYSGEPIDLTVTVRSIAENATQSFGDAQVGMGDAVWVEAQGALGLDIVLISRRVQTFHPDGFTKLGVELASKEIILVKSSQHYRAGFAAIAGAMLDVHAGGLLSLDYRGIPYRNFSGRYWPDVDDPFETT